MAMTDDNGRLACGRRTSEVWDHLDAPLDEHELSCRSCREARSALLRVRAATREFTAAEEDLQTRPSLKKSIMEIARAEVRRSRMLPLTDPVVARLEAELTISEQSIAQRIRTVADTFGGVRARRCVVDLDRIDRVAVEADTEATAVDRSHRPAHLIVTLRVAVGAGEAIPELIARLRTAVVADLARRTGLVVNAINVTVEDVFDA